MLVPACETSSGVCTGEELGRGAGTAGEGLFPGNIEVSCGRAVRAGREERPHARREGRARPTGSAHRSGSIRSMLLLSEPRVRRVSAASRDDLSRGGAAAERP